MKYCTKRIVDKINRYMKKDGLELKKLEYGVEVLCINITKIFMTLALAYLLDIIFYSLILILSFNLIRRYAFGVHCKKDSSCIIATNMLFVGGAYICKFIEVNIIFSIIISLIILISLIKYAPGDTEERPILGKEKRRKLKSKSILCACVNLCIALIIKDEIIGNLIFIGTLLECISINPLVYKLLNRRYRNYEKFETQD